MTFKDYYKEDVNSFVIPEKIKKNYQISGNLSNVKNWKAKILLGNSMPEGKKVGDWDEVGYTAISTKDNTIIPIARSDEHQAGYELIHSLRTKKLIHNVDYKTVFRGNNYIYNEEDFNISKTVFQKWLSYGGNNTRVEEMGGEVAGFMTDIIKANSLKDLAGTVKKGQLKSFGRELVKDLEELAKMSIRVNKTESPEDIEQYNNMALNFLDTHIWSLIDCGLSQLKEKEESLNKNFQDYKNTDQMFFGMNGIKNQIHMALRKANAKDKYEYGKLIKIFGDIDFAKKEFDRLGNI